MAFPTAVVEQLLVACHRHCCLCHKYCGNKVEIHHIVPRAQGGEDTEENAIPLCFDCHAEVEAYNTQHPRGRRFTPSELKKHKQQWFLICATPPWHTARRTGTFTPPSSHFFTQGSQGLLSDGAFDQWCLQLGLSDQAKALIQQIRISPPSRRVQSAAGNVSGSYPSQKMGCTIQFESHRNELALIHRLEHDPEVLEFYDQPGRIKLTYQSKNGRLVGVLHTPDFFVLRRHEAGWIECKMEEHLPELREKMPSRYRHNLDGTWFCPPGEEYAKAFGLFYRIFSSREIDWTYQQNLQFLEDYLRAPPLAVASDLMMTLRTTVMSQPGISLLDLLHSIPHGSADDLYFLIVTDQLYVNLHRTPLADPAHIQVFLNREVAEAHVMMQSSPFAYLPRPSVLSLAVGTPLILDGKAWTVFNPGETEVILLSENKKLMPLPHEAFEELIQTGRLTGVTAQTVPAMHEEANRLLAKANPTALEEATRRYTLIATRHRSTSSTEPVSERTLRRWQAQFQAAEMAYGNGFIGLLPHWNERGNRGSRLDDRAENLLEQFITTRYETLKQQPKHEVYLLLKREAENKEIPVPSYTAFLTRIKQRSRVEQVRKRQGKRAASQVKTWYWELEATTPRHGDHPWEIVHLDHTLLDIELVSAHTGRSLGRPWATFLTDAFSRRLLVVYLTFDSPSYRSCMMALRECVWRYERFPQTIIVDGGADFQSTHFETLLAYYGCMKATRPWAKPRYGSVIERLFGTANTQFLYNLTGNTQIMKRVRQVTKAVQPGEQAVWTLGDLYAYLCEWAYEVYDTSLHPTLGVTPREAFKTGLALGGERAHPKIVYNDDFRFLSLPTTRKGTARVEPGRGVKINYLYYWSDALRSPIIEGTQVLVRYDPFDIGVAYAYVQGRWVKCLSQYYLQLHGHSERELQLASTELCKRHQTHAGASAITSKRLAEFLASTETHEQILAQRLRDLEARDVLAHMGGSPIPAQDQVLSESEPISIPSSSVHQNRSNRVRSDEQKLEEEEEDLEDLEEYEEYR